MTRTDIVQMSKVPAVTLGFWIIKILATTLGETGGDAVSMSWLGETTPSAGTAGLNGYLVGTALFGAALAILAWWQIRARKFSPWLYWATIIASTTAGTTLADFATRSIGLGYPGGAMLLFGLVLASLFAWHRMLGTVDVNRIASARAETFYWITITFSQTLGTALGDWVADGSMGYSGAALLFGGMLAVLAALYFLTAIWRVALFWAAFILTRPLGATVGDFLDKPVAKGGLDLSRPIATAVLAATIVLLIVLLPQRAGKSPRARGGRVLSAPVNPVISAVAGPHPVDSKLLVTFLVMANALLGIFWLGSEVLEGDVFALDRVVLRGLRGSPP